MTFTDEAAQLAAYEGQHRTVQTMSYDFDRDRPQGVEGRHRDDTLAAQLLDDAIRVAADRIAWPHLAIA